MSGLLNKPSLLLHSKILKSAVCLQAKNKKRRDINAIAQVDRNTNSLYISQLSPLNKKWRNEQRKRERAADGMGKRKGGMMA